MERQGSRSIARPGTGRVALSAALLAGVLALPASAADERKDDAAESTEGSSAAAGVRRTGRAVVQDLKQAGRAIRDSKAGRAVTDGARDVGHEAARTGREVGRASAELGRQVGRTSAELGREVGHEAAAAGRQVGRTSSRLAGQVRDATVTFWNDVIGAKEHKAERLRRENRELERKRGSPAGRTKAEEAGG